MQFPTSPQDKKSRACGLFACGVSSVVSRHDVLIACARCAGESTGYAHIFKKKSAKSVTMSRMRKKFLHSLQASLEWRLVAFIITNIFFWITTGQFLEAAGLALTLQLILFVAYVTWHFFRNELHTPLLPDFITGYLKKSRPQDT